MNTTQRHHDHGSPNRHHTDSQGITLGNLMIDAARLGPAPSRTREAAVIVVTLILLGIVAALIRPEVAIIAVVGGVVAVSFVARWAVGTRKWDRR